MSSDAGLYLRSDRQPDEAGLVRFTDLASPFVENGILNHAVKEHLTARLVECGFNVKMRKLEFRYWVDKETGETRVGTTPGYAKEVDLRVSLKRWEEPLIVATKTRRIRFRTPAEYVANSKVSTTESDEPIPGILISPISAWAKKGRYGCVPDFSILWSSISTDFIVVWIPPLLRWPSSLEIPPREDPEGVTEVVTKLRKRLPWGWRIEQTKELYRSWANEYRIFAPVEAARTSSWFWNYLAELRAFPQPPHEEFPPQDDE